MSKYNDIYNKVLTKEKIDAEKHNIVLSKIVRPLCVLFTVPFLNTSIAPTTITIFSVISLIVGFVFFIAFQGLVFQIAGWLFFFIWVILDGVDGNLARYKNQTSEYGEIWDAFGGYCAIVLFYYSSGCAACFGYNRFEFCNPVVYLLLGSASAILAIFPRLMLHKIREIKSSKTALKEFTGKASFSPSKAIAHNLLSLSGLFQIILLCAILTRTLNVFVAIYFCLNFLFCIATLFKLLRK